MKRIIILLLLTALLVPLHTQNAMQKLLESIEQNNTQLKALREMNSAEKLENKTANNLVNPEVEITHKPKARGNYAETGIEATQSFDFPTAYKHRGQIIGLQNEQVDLAYNVAVSDVLYEARLMAVEYIYQDKLMKLTGERVKYARELNDAYERLFERGDINILEKNKTKLNLLEAEKELQICVVDRNDAIAELVRMNGGEAISLLPDDYTSHFVLADFNSWYEKIKHRIPQLQVADKNVDMSRKQEQLTRSLNLPKLRAGYVGDLMKNENRHGFLVSVSVPLWEGRNTIKSKKIQTVAKQYEREDAEVQLKNTLRSNFEKAEKLSTLLKEYREVIDNSNNFLLLKKSFDMGQLTLIDYLQELIIYNRAVDEYLNTQKTYNIALSDIERWEN